ncbi:Hypothetical protein PHPALM_12435 [Phytophthora palmivora]|uniref:Uncharacterized protein n=1 Tax=Phytophthora palmivora TaxID=4796 RepID=A0A2P4XZX6_9STRA|nr:Hypothetical protein PHPALM_12435 [Phytophthora palmivora]
MKVLKWTEREREETARCRRRRRHLIVAVVSSIAAVPHKRESNFQTTRCLGGTSVSAIYEAMHSVMDAISECPELRISSPTESPQRMLDLSTGLPKLTSRTS